MTDNKKKFLEYVTENEEIKKKLESLGTDATADQVIAFAKENGFALTEEDFNPEPQEIDSDELETVAGGGGCGCFLAGGGKGDGLVCACPVVGGGAITHDRTACTNAGEGACACYAGGAGATNGCRARR